MHNVRERWRWRREVGTLVTWEQVRELTKRDATEWVLLGNLKKRGYVGWGHNWRGGWDAVALQNRRTGALFAVKEKTWDVAKRKGVAWRIPTLEGGEVSESEIDELLPRLRDPKTRYEAQCRLGRVSARATTLVPALLALLDDEDEDVRGAAVGALGMIGPLAKSAVPALLRIVAEGTRWREEAVRSLGLMGTAAREAVPDLVRIVVDGSCGDLRGEAVRALAQMEPHANAIPAFVHVFRVPELRSEIYWELYTIVPIFLDTVSALSYNTVHEAQRPRQVLPQGNLICCAHAHVPRQRNSRTVVHSSALAGWTVVPLLRIGQFSVPDQAQIHDAPMPRERVREEVQRSFGDSNAGVEPRIPSLGDCLLSSHY